MQNDPEMFSRRQFLQWSAITGLAIAGTPSAFSADSAETPAPTTERQPPTHPVRLQSDELEVILDAADGLPYEYRLKSNGATLRGEDFGQPLTVTFCRKEPWSFPSFAITPEKHTSDGTNAVFHFRATHNGALAGSFSLRYALRQATLLVTLEDIKEHPGFELIDLAMPNLVTVRESDKSAWLAHGDEGGSLVMLSSARPGHLPLNRFWGNVQGTLPVVMVGTANALCVQETTAFMDGTLLSVVGAEGVRRASLGTDKVHRVNGGACYDLNLARGKPLNCGNPNTPNLLVEQPSSCRLDFLPITGDPAKAWIVAGKLVRNRMPEMPSAFYNDKYVYGILCDQPLFAEPSATFAQCGEIIGRIAALTDHSPQIVHLWGWQFRGKDTGYPAVNVVDERIGGYDGMMRLMDQGRALNATVTLSDNYDDAYRSSPAWNSDYIARRPDGGLWESRAWTGERSYILGLAKYMEGPGAERVRYTCEHYKLKDTTHIDVLSYYSIRNDWDPKHPASGIRDLFDGRYKVLEGFAAHGVDVSSEALRYPMIGRISAYWYLSASVDCPFGGSPIPLIPLVYGKSAVWGLSGHAFRGDPTLKRIWEHFYGARPCDSFLRADKPLEQALDSFYLGAVPFFQLRGRNLEDFERNGDQTRIHLESGALLECNVSTSTLRISLNGAPVLENDAVFCPLGEDKIACYSITPRTVTVTLPPNWNSAQVTGVVLYPDHREPAKMHVSAGKVQVTLESRRPVILYRAAPSTPSAG